MNAAAPATPEASAGPVGRNLRAALFLAVLVAGLALSYAPALDAPFVHDDLFQITRGPRLSAVRDGRQSLLSLLVPRADHRRPLPFFTFALNYLLLGDSPRSFRLVNLALHLLNTLLLLGLGRRMARVLTGADPPFAPLALGALLWAFQPAHTQAVTYIVQRMTLLCALFSLAALWLWVAAGERHGPRRLALHLGAVAAGILALLSKESAAALPLLVILWEWVAPRGSRKRLAGLAAAAGALYLAGVLALVHLSAGEAGYYAGRYGTLAERLLSQPRMFWHYLGLLAFPHSFRMAIETDPGFSTALFSPPTTLPALAGLVALLAAAAALARRRSLPGLGLLCFVAALLPESGFWPIALSGDHRLYLPSALLLAALGASAAAGPRPRLRAGILAAGVGLLCLLTLMRNGTWRTETGVWRDAVAKAPRHYPNWQNLAAAEMRARRLSAALVAIGQVRALNPTGYNALLTEAYIHLTLGRLPTYRARRPGGAACDAARRDASRDPVAALATAECETEDGRGMNAVEFERRAGVMAPDTTFLTWFAAWDLAAQGQAERAREIAALDRTQPEYERLLLQGTVELAAGQADAAAGHFRQAADHDSGRVEAFVGLGRSLEKTDPAGAVDALRRARALDPALAPVTAALCDALTAAGAPDASAACALAALMDPAPARAGAAGAGQAVP